ncbi:MAG: hypothetical protein ACD_76C00085G0001 [uncultured bacterium]|nr:MAG: hypothetical protein ACD_76C00085G0001 [uncultured bacterium]HBD05541.1 hypothetical protein [Candidatus Uhrbacteria bacterium]
MIIIEFINNPLFWLMAILWFVLYWIFGGVLFSLIAFFQMKRIRKVRFSCLFTFWSVASALAGAYAGIWLSQDAISECGEIIAQPLRAAITEFACGFAGIMIGMSGGAAVLLIGGFLLLILSRSKTASWYDKDRQATENEEEE